MADILHCDLNSFYASVEIRDNPELKGLPVAVCGSVEDRSGIVLAKNDLAKAFGVQTGEKIYDAKKKCPSLVTVSPHYSKYEEASRSVRKIYARYTDRIESFGLDECWLDITGSHLLFGSSVEIANKIREEVKRETGLTISVGVSFTKVLAKLGSDLKKPDAVSVLPKENYMQIIKNLDISELIGIGPATKRALNKLKIYTLGELAGCDAFVLQRHLGKNGIWLWRAVNGVECSEVSKYGDIPKPKSISCSRTAPKDLTTNAEVWQAFLTLSCDVCKRLRSEKFYASGVCISIKTNDLQYHEYQMPLELPLMSALSLAEAGFELFCERFDWRLPIRALGIRAINLMPIDLGRQCTLFSNSTAEDKRDALSWVSDSLEARFGKDIVHHACIESTPTVNFNPFGNRHQ